MLLRKLKKDDYLIAKSYRPILLLSTLGKVLELLVANRIGYLIEAYSLLPKTYFRARKQRSTLHALLYLYKDVLERFSKVSAPMYNSKSTD